MRFLIKEEANTKRTNELLKQISLVANSAGSVFQKIRAIAKIRQDNRTNEVIQNRCGKVLDKLYNIRYGEKRDFISKGELDEDLGKDVFEKNGKKYITGPRGTFEISTKSEKELKKDGYGYHHTINKDDKKYDVYTKDSDALAIVKENKKELDLDEALGLKEDRVKVYFDITLRDPEGNEYIEKESMPEDLFLEIRRNANWPSLTSYFQEYYDDEVVDVEQVGYLKEDTIKQNGKWVNKGKEGTHGTFKTKKAADAQRRAIWVNWDK